MSNTGRLSPFRLRKYELFRVLYVGRATGTHDNRARNVQSTGRRLADVHRAAFRTWTEAYGDERVESVHIKIVTVDQVAMERRA